MITLDELGVGLAADQSSLRHNYLETYEKIISDNFVANCKIVIISNQNPIELANIFSQRFPQATIDVHSYKDKFRESICDNIKNVFFTYHDSLEVLLSRDSIFSNIDFVIEDSSNIKSHKLKIFKKLFLKMNTHGIYFIEDLHASYMPNFVDTEGDGIIDYLNKIITCNSLPTSEKSKCENINIELCNVVDSITFKNNLAIVAKKGMTLQGLRSDEILTLLSEDVISGENLYSESRPDDFLPVNSSIGHPLEYLKRHQKKFSLFSPYINKFNNINCRPGQLAWVDNFLIPDSFRMQHHKELSHRYLKNLGNSFYRFDIKNISYNLKGNYLYLDSEYPAHFGHFTSEIVSRLWAWDILKKEIPDLKVLIGLNSRKPLPGFSKKILNAFGIPDADICTFQDHIMVENLFTACPQYVIGSHIDPKIKITWDKISEGITGGEAKLKGNKIFIARPEKGVRRCLNPDKLEETFREYGFEFFSPEKHSWEDQIRTFSQANVIAGYAGSGMFNTMFSSGVRSMIVIGADSYTAKNEHFICSVKNIDLYYIWADSELKQNNGWNKSAYASDFKFNYERDESFLLETLNKLF